MPLLFAYGINGINRFSHDVAQLMKLIFHCKGDVCPAGKYCPISSPSGQDCPPGTFLNTTGAQSDTECIQCTQGYYCGGYGLTAVTDQCDAGYYCPAGMNVSNPTEYTCPQGNLKGIFLRY